MKSLLLSLSFFSLIILCLADVDTELAKLEGELEKLQLNKAKRELVNDVEEFLSAREARKRTVQSKEEGKEATELKEAKRSEEKSLDDLLEEYNAKKHKKETTDAREEFFNVFIDRKQRREEEAILEEVLGELIKNEVSKALSKRSADSNGKCLTAKDLRDDCAHYKKIKGCDGKYTEIMNQYCYKTCRCGCVDVLDKNTCNRLLKSRACVFRKKDMLNYCPGTCGFCKTPAPPPCAKTPYGCCWDDVTTKSDAKGTNCPKCYDEYKVACRTFKPDCRSDRRPGIFMRKYCSHSCEECVEKCLDHPEHASTCHLWKQNGACESDQQSMKLYCPQTCGLCGKLSIDVNNAQGK